MEKAPTFTVVPTSQVGQSLLQWRDGDGPSGLHSIQMPAQIAECLAMSANSRYASIEALEAARIFLTPLERRKGWNEFKQDAANRITALVGLPS